MKKKPRVTLLIETTHSYGRGLLRGIAEYSKIHGPWSFYREVPFYGHPRNQRSRLYKIQNEKPDGIIMREPNVHNIEVLMDLKIPMIISPNLLNPKIPTIVTNAKMIGELAADHLLDRGFKNFAYCGFENMPWSLKRYDSFTQRIELKRFKVVPILGSVTKILNPNRKDRMKFIDFLKSLPKPLGVMVCNDDVGRAILEMCKSADIPVPEQIAVIGVDDDKLTCELTNPPLSSIALHSEKIGYETAALLDRLMQGEKMNGQIIFHDPSHVSMRQSTDVVAIDDPDVSKALSFIRQHFKDPINVDDVADSVVLSKRHLYKKFMESLGHSVHHEIKKTRCEHICRLLIDSDLSISQITMTLGFTGIEHISRYFHKETGVSLHEFRRKFRK